jgi:hypothetical protein
MKDRAIEKAPVDGGSTGNAVADAQNHVPCFMSRSRALRS